MSEAMANPNSNDGKPMRTTGEIYRHVREAAVVETSNISNISKLFVREYLEMLEEKHN